MNQEHSPEKQEQATKEEVTVLNSSTTVNHANHALVQATPEGYFLDFRSISPMILHDSEAKNFVKVNITDYNPVSRIFMSPIAFEQLVKALTDAQSKYAKIVSEKTSD